MPSCPSSPMLDSHIAKMAMSRGLAKKWDGALIPQATCLDSSWDGRAWVLFPIPTAILVFLLYWLVSTKWITKLHICQLFKNKIAINGVGGSMRNLWHVIILYCWETIRSCGKPASHLSKWQSLSHVADAIPFSVRMFHLFQLVDSLELRKNLLVSLFLHFYCISSFWYLSHH